MFFIQKSKKPQGYLNLQKEMEKILSYRCSEFQIVITSVRYFENSNIIDLTIGINFGIFKGARLHPSIYVSSQYPIRWPFIYNDVVFPHPNINQITKEIVLSILEQWNPVLYLSDVLLQLALTLTKPDLRFVPNNSLNSILAIDYLYRDTKPKFFQLLSDRSSKIQIQDAAFSLNNTMEVEDEEEVEEGPTRTCNMDFTKLNHLNPGNQFAIDFLALNISGIRIEPQSPQR